MGSAPGPLVPCSTLALQRWLLHRLGVVANSVVLGQHHWAVLVEGADWGGGLSFWACEPTCKAGKLSQLLNYLCCPVLQKQCSWVDNSRRETEAGAELTPR